MGCGTPGSSVFHYLLEFAQIPIRWVDDAIYFIPCRPLLLLPLIFPSIRVLSNGGSSHWKEVAIRWPKYWSFNFNIGPSSEYSGLISFRIDWFDLFAAEGTLKSLLQQYIWRASIFRHLAFFIARLSQPYPLSRLTYCLSHPTGKTVYLVFDYTSYLINS